MDLNEKGYAACSWFEYDPETKDTPADVEWWYVSDNMDDPHKVARHPAGIVIDMHLSEETGQKAQVVFTVEQLKTMIAIAEARENA